MRRTLDLVFLAGGILAGVCLVAILALVVAQIVTRLMGTLIPSADEFAGFCLSATSFLGLAYAFRHGAHIRVTLFVNHAPTRLKWLFNLAALAVSTAMIGYFTWYAVNMVWDSWRFGDVTGGLVPLPLWLPQTGMAVGLVLFTLALLEVLVMVAVGGPGVEDPSISEPDVPTLDAD